MHHGFVYIWGNTEPRITKHHMASIFSKIVAGEIPCYKIAEDQDFFAFLDISPNAKGHTLCIPKKEVDKITDLDETTYLGLMAFSRRVAIAIEKAVDCKRVGITVIGLEVPHVHVHLIPLSYMEDATFQKKVTLSSTEFEVTAKAISAAFE
ncbi:HIT family protein [Croceitalea dokdonensis DOKDO 023]|uniref:HIT family protein n=2 Tax=Croceitalea TaxID=574891 RepID=A0A0P7B1D4_9FLAO|nr:HIT family protein [Croceitalea dokdonensis DOKDO 023]